MATRLKFEAFKRRNPPPYAIINALITLGNNPSHDIFWLGERDCKKYEINLVTNVFSLPDCKGG